MLKKSLILTTIILVVLTLTTACTQDKNNSTRNGYDYLVLVNKYSQLPDDWEKKVKLVNATNAWKEKIKVEKEAYEQYNKLAKELKNEGINIELDSVYRSVKDQQALWDEWSEDPEKGIEYVKKYVAVPGYSEHHTGLAIDICLKKGKKLVYENDDMIADTKTFAKIHKKLAKYGFILRYLKDRDETTGYSYEPWHLRYIGSPKIAKEIMDKNITFEEYLESQKDLVNNPSAAKYHIEKKLQKEFKNNIYKDKITNSRFNVKNIYTYKDAKSDKTIKSLKLGKHDIAFDVMYQIQPKDGIDTKELMVADGEYDKQLGWIKNIQRVGVLRQNQKDYSLKLENFGTGW